MRRFDKSIFKAPRMVSGKNGVVTSQHYVASYEGAKILRAGGTAMDAAVATAFVLAVVEPWMSGLGGVGYMIVGQPGKEAMVIDFSARSPVDLRIEDYPLSNGVSDDLFPWPNVKDNRNTIGGLSVCAPMMAPGMELGWQKYGRMPWADLLAPAIEQSHRGLLIDWHAQLMIASAASDIRSDPYTTRLFMNQNTINWTTLSKNPVPLPALNDSLQILAIDGADALVKGDLARSIVDDVCAKGGRLSMKDFELSTPRFCQPIKVDIDSDKTVWATPGLSGGQTVIELLQNWKKITIKNDTLSQRVKNGIDILQQRLCTLGEGREQPKHPSCTTSFCVVDKNGMTIAANITLVSIFGSKLLSNNTGVLLNNAISWFNPTPNYPNSLAANRQPLSNMAPILIDDAKGNLTAIAAAGGRRIPPAVAQIVAQMTLDGATCTEALSAPRVDFRADKGITADLRLDQNTLDSLKKIGDTMQVYPTVFPYYFAILNAAEYNPIKGATGFSEPFYPNAETISS